MVIDLLELRNGELEISKTLELSEDIIKKAKMIDLLNTTVNGNIRFISDDNFELDLNVKGIMVLPCSMTLKPVNHEFEAKIEDDLLSILNEMDENIKKTGNTIDIFPIIWENILMEIPIKVISGEDIVTKEGNGWKLIEEDEEKEIINPEFAKLKDLL